MKTRLSFTAALMTLIGTLTACGSEPTIVGSWSASPRMVSDVASGAEQAAGAPLAVANGMQHRVQPAFGASDMPLTDEVLPVLEDKSNHTIDALRYALEGLRRAPSPTVVTPSRNPPDLWGRPKGEVSNWKTA